MARKKIPLKDKIKIKKRLAKGQSQREAIKGTVVKSPTTAGNIAKRELDEIGQIRERYLQLIESFGAGEIDRARLWAEMTRATKYYAGQEIPDWTNRSVAMKYLDGLAGLSSEGQKPGQQFNQFNFYNIPPEKLREYQRRALNEIERR